MASFRTSRTFDLIFLGLVGAVLVVSALNRTAIGDTVFFWHYQPTAQTITVATDAGLNSTGRRLLYRSNPQFASNSEVTAQCDIERLGCLTPHGVAYIFADPTKPHQTIVTAAHEMLHLAYQRLSEAKKTEIAPLIDEAITENSPAITAELQAQTTPEDRRDEAHSLLGTEYAHLPPELETYYQAYFADRSKVVADAKE